MIAVLDILYKYVYVCVCHVHVRVNNTVRLPLITIIHYTIVLA